MRLIAVAAVFLLSACPADSPGPPTGLDDSWNVLWTCVGDCTGRTISLLEADLLTVSGGTATWNTEPASTLTGDRTGECLDVAAGTALPNPADAGWSIQHLGFCERNDDLSGEIQVIGPADEQATWTMDAVR